MPSELFFRHISKMWRFFFPYKPVRPDPKRVPALEFMYCTKPIPGLFTLEFQSLADLSTDSWLSALCDVDGVEVKASTRLADLESCIIHHVEHFRGHSGDDKMRIHEKIIMVCRRENTTSSDDARAISIQRMPVHNGSEDR